MSTDKSKGIVSLHEVTRKLLHEYYSGFTTDPDIFMDMSKFYTYHYDPEKVDARIASKKNTNERRDFMIMVDDTVVGEICLKHIDYDKRECELSIHMQNDSVKNKGYGTQAEKIAVQYAFEKLKMNTVLADSVLKNLRSQHVLEKVGFSYVGQDDTFKYYRYEREAYNKNNLL